MPPKSGGSGNVLPPKRRTPIRPNHPVRTVQTSDQQALQKIAAIVDPAAVFRLHHPALPGAGVCLQFDRGIGAQDHAFGLGLGHVEPRALYFRPEPPVAVSVLFNRPNKILHSFSSEPSRMPIPPELSAARRHSLAARRSTSNRSYHRLREPPLPRRNPPPDPRSVLGRASFTLSARPPISAPFSSAMARSASAALLISTKPKPLA